MSEASGIDLTGEISEVLKVDGPGNVMVVTYVDGEGQPRSTIRSSVHVHGRDTLAMWVRDGYVGAMTVGAQVGESQWTPSPTPRPSGFLTAIRSNPKVAVLYRDAGAMVTYSVVGRARVAEGDTARAAVFAGIPEGERRHSTMKSGEVTGTPVIIDVDSIVGGALGAEGVIASHVEMRR
jgi:hypothetical protein